MAHDVQVVEIEPTILASVRRVGRGDDFMTVPRSRPA